MTSPSRPSFMQAILASISPIIRFRGDRATQGEGVAVDNNNAARSDCVGEIHDEPENDDDERKKKIIKQLIRSHHPRQAPAKTTTAAMSLE